MVNAGAIVMCSMLKQKMNLADRFDFVSVYCKVFGFRTGKFYTMNYHALFMSNSF